MPDALHAATQTCPECGRYDDGEAALCGLCGHLLRRAVLSAPTAEELTTASAGARQSAAAATLHDASADRARKLEPWFFLGLGLVIAPVFALTPMLSFMGWFLASLAHEMGHSALAWLCGMPSIPAISPAGHAAAVHGGQMLFLVAVIVGVTTSYLWRRLQGARRGIAIAGFVVAYAILAFTPVREFAFLIAGHGGELAFATLCLFKALDGGFTESRAERLAYGVLGWFLTGKNLLLFVGLVGSRASRADYAESGSFGLTNDMLRVAEDVLGWRLESVASWGVLASLLVLPAALYLWRLSSAARAAD